jgi:hypothetical protein
MATPAFKPAKQLNTANKWGDRSRFYQTPEGDVYPSVTSILSVIGKPALINWAAKTEREMVIEAAACLWEDVPALSKKMSRLAYIATLQDRIGKTKAHQKELAKASEIGSQVHGLIEWNLRKELGQTVGPEPVIKEKALWAFMAYEDWRKQAGLQPVAIEQVVWSTQYRYAGTMDVYGRLTIGGEPCYAVLDWKSGKAIYDEALLQNAAYVQALIEMGHAYPPCYGVIVRLPKIESDPDFEVKWITPDEHAALFKAFLSARALWQWQHDREQAKAESVPA